ncbi:hypothetical protein [Vibrio sp. 10N.239.312.D08]|uniref:hypothetical protein n=1 Tax=Vibrio sp. 10N.239.312.D08 TaxID=3229978 RepID=UPI0035543C0B
MTDVSKAVENKRPTAKKTKPEADTSIQKEKNSQKTDQQQEVSTEKNNGQQALVEALEDQQAKPEAVVEENNRQQRKRDQNRGTNTQQDEQNKRQGSRRQQSGASGRQRATQRMLAAIASKSEVVENEEAQNYSAITPIVQFRSHTLSRYLKSELQNIMLAASDVIPLIQATQRVEEFNSLFDDFTKETIEAVNEVSSSNLEVVGIIKENDPRIEQRLSAIEMSSPVEFKFVFLHPFFWDYINMLGNADQALHEIEKVILTGAMNKDMEQLKTDIIQSVRQAFTALSFISKIRTRMDARSPIKVEQFKNIQSNFRRRMATVSGVNDEEVSEESAQTNATKEQVAKTA